MANSASALLQRKAKEGRPVDEQQAQPGTEAVPATEDAMKKEPSMTPDAVRLRERRAALKKDGNGKAAKAAKPKAPRAAKPDGAPASAKLSGGPKGKTVFLSGTVPAVLAMVKAAIGSGKLSEDGTATAQKWQDRLTGK